MTMKWDATRERHARGTAAYLDWPYSPSDPETMEPLVSAEARARYRPFYVVFHFHAGEPVEFVAFGKENLRQVISEVLGAPIAKPK